MADASAYAENIKKYAKGYNKAAAEKIVGHLGIALRNKDSSVVACSDGGELDRIRDRWCRNKLGLALNADALDWLAGVGYDPVYGARPLKRAIQRELETPIGISP
jgi:hypothetical protein